MSPHTTPRRTGCAAEAVASERVECSIASEAVCNRARSQVECAHWKTGYVGIAGPRAGESPRRPPRPAVAEQDLRSPEARDAGRAAWGRRGPALAHGRRRRLRPFAHRSVVADRAPAPATASGSFDWTVGGLLALVAIACTGAVVVLRRKTGGRPDRGRGRQHARLAPRGGYLTSCVHDRRGRPHGSPDGAGDRAVAADGRGDDRGERVLRGGRAVLRSPRSSGMASCSGRARRCASPTPTATSPTSPIRRCAGWPRRAARRST